MMSGTNNPQNADVTMIKIFSFEDRLSNVME